MLKAEILPVLLFSFLCISSESWAADIQALKIDFLQGNYRRVIFEGQNQGDNLSASSDELNYLLGLSYLKEGKLSLAGDFLAKIAGNRSSKYKAQAALALADSLLVSGRFLEAEQAYNKLINDQPNSAYKAAVLYRLSQLEFKRGNNAKGNEYLSKLRRDFPLCPELKLNKGFDFRQAAAGSQEGQYSVQVGVFSSYLNARKFTDQLKAGGFSAYVEDSSAGYRVKVGKFGSVQEASRVEEKLIREGYPTKLSR